MVAQYIVKFMISYDTKYSTSLIYVESTADFKLTKISRNSASGISFVDIHEKMNDVVMMTRLHDTLHNSGMDMGQSTVFHNSAIWMNSSILT